MILPRVTRSAGGEDRHPRFALAHAAERQEATMATQPTRSGTDKEPTVKIDDRTPPETRAVETGALRKGWAAEMLARAEARHDTGSPARTCLAGAKRRVIRRVDGPAAQPSGPGGRRAVTLTLARP
jgi:hypothetical protein